MIMNNLFGFAMALGESSIKPSDYLIISLYTILALAYSKDKHLFSVKKDELGSVILGCFLWTLLVFFGTILFSQDTPTFAFKSYRAYLVIPFYFVLRTMTMKQVERYVKLMFAFSIVQGVFFYLQLVGITGIISGYGATIESGESLAEHRFGNYPSFAPFFFVYILIKKEIALSKKIPMLLFWGMMPVVGQMRGGIMALAFTCGIYFVLHRKLKNVVYIVLAAVLYQFVVSPMFSEREKNYDVSTTDEIKMIFQNPTNIYKTYVGNSEDGTFIFRIAMYEERIAYMLEHPIYALEGVGCIHEDSPKNKFKFTFGTVAIKDDGDVTIGMLASADIAWVGILMHFGFMGVFLFTLLYYKWMKIGLVNVVGSRNDIFTISAIQSVGAYLESFNGESIGRITMLSFMFTLAVLTVYLKGKDKKNYG